MNIIRNLKTPVFYTVAVVGVIYYLERKKNVPVLDNFGIVAEKCIGSIRGLFSKLIENKSKEHVESFPESE
jgi:predicted solute-binding protein